MEDIAARELSLYADNTEPLYRMRMAIAKNLATKKARGTYDREKSLVAWGYLAKAAAQAYVKEMGSPGDKWNVMFNKESRDAFCRAYREEFEQEYKNGEYEAILPAKYQKKATKKSTAAAMQKLAEKRDAAPTVSTPRPKESSTSVPVSQGKVPPGWVRIFAAESGEEQWEARDRAIQFREKTGRPTMIVRRAVTRGGGWHIYAKSDAAPSVSTPRPKGGSGARAPKKRAAGATGGILRPKAKTPAQRAKYVLGDVRYAEGHRFRGWNIQPTVLQEPKLFPQIFPELGPADHLRLAQKFAEKADKIQSQLHKWIMRGEKTYGAHGALISGGFREHWPESVKNTIRRLAQGYSLLKSAAHAHSIAWHR